LLVEVFGLGMNEPLHVALLCHSGAGGSGIVATELAVMLADKGHHVHLIGEQRPFRLDSVSQATRESGVGYRDLGEMPPPRSFWGQLVELVRASLQRQRDSGTKKGEPLNGGTLHFHEILTHDYPLFETSPHPTIRSANTIAAVFERYDIQIVNAHYAIPHATAAILARDAGVPVRVITTLHGTDITHLALDPAYRYTTQHALKCSDAVTSVSRWLGQLATERFPMAKPICHIPNWVDGTRFVRPSDPRERSRYAQPEEFICAHISNFRPVKNPLKVIDIFARILEKTPARLLLIGEGPLKSECITAAVDRGISGRVLSVPSLPNVEKMLGLVDVLLLPSESESLPLILLEAMASGAVCVASNVGGIPELIRSGETGLLFDSDDAEGMADAAVEIWQNATLRERIKTDARGFVLESHSPDRIVSLYEEQFRQLCG
jgi:L-malate glycosyltransferase